MLWNCSLKTGYFRVMWISLRGGGGGRSSRSSSLDSVSPPPKSRKAHTNQRAVLTQLPFSLPPCSSSKSACAQICKSKGNSWNSLGASGCLLGAGSSFLRPVKRPPGSAGPWESTPGHPPVSQYLCPTPILPLRLSFCFCSLCLL